MARPDYYPEADFAVDRRSRTQFRLLMITVVLVFLAGMFLLAWTDHRRSAARAHQQLGYFAELFQQSLEASLNIANLKMWAMIDDISYVPFRQTENVDDIYGRRLRRTVEDVPQIDSLLLIDTEGTVMWSTTEVMVGLNLADRAYFQKAITMSRGEFTVGSPINSRGTARRLTPIAWPIISSAGELRGIFVSSLGEPYFAELLSLQGVEDDMIVRIVTADGATAFATGTDGLADPGRLMTASRPIGALGLEIQVSRSRRAVLRNYWDRTLAFGFIATLLFFTVLLSAIRARSQSVMLAAGLKRSEQDRLKIQTTQREFDAIFENVGDGIVVFDDIDTLHRSNLAARRFLDVDDDESAVHRLRERLPPFADIPKETAVYPLNLAPRDPGGPPQRLQCRVMKLHLYGTDIAYCVLEDISAEERLAETRMSFVTSVNHELRTPLTSLSGALDLLRARFEAELPAGAKKLVNMAARNADRLLVLVNDILTLQAIDQQQLSINREPVAVAEALSEAVTTNTGYGVGRDVSIAADPLPTGEDPVLLLDRVRLQQVLANLISNAIKYSPPGSQVRIGAEIHPRSVRFYVSDTGPGIPEDALDRLFDRFTKPVHGHDIQVSGTGLGLAITRELVHRQGGEITVESRAQADGAKDSGTTFHVSFQRQSGTEGQTA
ncbi:ATP-binding protein [Pseudooceanicola aestuarii]|uniref:ATP-binding protein n=1 Tax=Pseudooceanicola aestuarii TaxID=2697319 RepID=UPI0013D023D5|nr:ATP-binding protein [Pseudooceanicola aestuarii]